MKILLLIVVFTAAFWGLMLKFFPRVAIGYILVLLATMIIGVAISLVKKRRTSH